MSLSEDFAELFDGLDRAYGIYNVVPTAGTKQKGDIETINGPVTVDLWDKHLAGTHGLGIVPIRDDGTCIFGAIDIDDYTIDIPKFVKKLSEAKIPAVPCRTKSGGLHLYFFFEAPELAGTVRSSLENVAAAIGYAGSEIFPKQNALRADRGDVGSWINMPYQAGEHTVRYAIDEDGEGIHIDDFIPFATRHKCSTSDLDFEAFSDSDLLTECPPCIATLVRQGVGTGIRNEVLFNLGVYTRKRYNDWQERLEELNREFIQPNLSSQEVQGAIKSLNRKTYEYTCSRDPIRSHCQALVCRSRQFGVGDASVRLPSFDGLTKLATDPPLWFVDVDGERLELTTEDLQNQHRFQRRCIEQLNVMMPMVNKQQWLQMWQQLLASVNIVEVPDDSSAKGQLFNLLDKFLNGKTSARNKSEILLGKPLKDDIRYYFRMSDFMAFLNRQRFFEFKVHQVTALIKGRGATHQFWNIDGRGTNLWVVRKEDDSEPTIEGIQDQGDVL